MTLLATYEKIQSIAGDVSGITSAPTAMPTALNSVSLPCVLTFPGPAEWNEHARGLYRQARTYYVRLYVKPVAEGLGIDEGYQASLSLINDLGDAFVRNPTLDSTVDHIGEQGEFSDGGKTVLEFAGILYHGCEIQLQVTEKTT